MLYSSILNPLKTKSRNQVVDIMKCIGMICIILGHLGSNTLNSFVFTFHLPLFFCLSGYFLNADISVKKLVHKKIRTLILPYITTCWLILFFQILIECLNGNLLSGNEFLGQQLEKTLIASFSGVGSYGGTTFPISFPPIGAIWFLLALFWGEIVLRLLLYLPQKICFLIVIFISVVIVRLYPYFQLPWSIQSGVSALPFLYTGYLLRQINLSEIKLKIKYTTGFILILLWVYGIMTFNGFYLDHAYYGNGVMDFICSLGGIIVVYLIAKMIADKNNKFSFALAYLGSYSIIILSLHLLNISIFRNFEFNIYFKLTSEHPVAVMTFFLFFEFGWILGATYLFSKSDRILRAYGINPYSKR